MFVRRRRSHGQVTWVAAHLPLTHAATPQESDKHKAMKERIARTPARHGLDVETEARSPDGRVVTDVLVTGAGARVGWEAQYSPITANTVRRRSAKARERNIAPLWVTSDDSSALIDRAPWTLRTSSLSLRSAGRNRALAPRSSTTWAPCCGSRPVTVT